MPALLAFHKRIYERDFTAARAPAWSRDATKRVLTHLRAVTTQECGPATKGHYKELMAKFPLARARVVSCVTRVSSC